MRYLNCKCDSWVISVRLQVWEHAFILIFPLFWGVMACVVCAIWYMLMIICVCTRPHKEARIGLWGWVFFIPLCIVALKRGVYWTRSMLVFAGVCRPGLAFYVRATDLNSGVHAAEQTLWSFDPSSCPILLSLTTDQVPSFACQSICWKQRDFSCVPAYAFGFYFSSSFTPMFWIFLADISLLVFYSFSHLFY